MDMMGPVLPTHRVLDAGSGRGGTAFSIVNRFDADVTGITIAPYQAKFSQDLAKNHWQTRKATFMVMNMLALGFDEDTFDHIITNETTMYISDLEKLFTGFRRVLKSQGKYTLATWCINETYEGREDLVEKINSHYPGTKMHTRQEYREAIATSGLSEIEYKDLTQDAIPHWE
jgi:geranyl diphosphate 2-C-methyltransferase